MIKPFDDIQMFNQSGVESAMKAFGELNKGWQAIAAELTDYSKRSFEDGTQTMEKLMSAKSIEQAVEIQTTFAKRAYDEYMHQAQKIGGMYSNVANEAYAPVERSLKKAR